MKRSILVLTAAALLIGAACMAGACSGKKDTAAGSGEASKASVSAAGGETQAGTKSGAKVILASDTKGDIKEVLKLLKQAADMNADYDRNWKAWTDAQKTQRNEILNKVGETLPTLNSAQVSELTTKNANPEGDFQYDLNEAGNGIVIKKYLGRSSGVIIPATIEGYPVVEIGKEAFYGRNTTTTSIVLPDTITKIGGGIFNGPFNSSLRAIYLSAGLREIGKNAFSSCGSLQSIRLPAGLQKIGSDAFRNCSSLKEVVIPEGIEFIEGGVFQNCTNLVSVTLPASIKKIGADNIYGGGGAFSGCTNLTDVIIPDSVTAIEWVLRRTQYDDEYYPEGSEFLDDWGGVKISVAFSGDGKLKLAVRKRLQDLGYKGDF